MPKSVRSLIHKCLYKGAITQEEHDKIIRKLDIAERKGEWKISIFESLRNMQRIGRCSECGTEGSMEWNFCPNCGARMVNEDD